MLAPLWQILDSTPLRYGLPPMSVTLAKFEQKGEEFVQRKANKKQVGGSTAGVG